MKSMRWGLAAAMLFASTLAGAADTEFDTSATNLIAVLRETPGANKQDEALHPFGAITATMPDGREVQFEPSWYQYLGDMHLRLVFDSERRLQSAAPDDLQRLKLSPDEALSLAVQNLRRRYGEPQVLPFGGGLMQLQLPAASLASSYFLDRDFWQARLREHPEGIVAALPQRSGVVFAPLADDTALTNLRFSAAALYTGHEARLSSALYLFKDGRWSVFQAAAAPARP